MLQNAKVRAFTISELLRETQWGRGGGTGDGGGEGGRGMGDRGEAVKLPPTQIKVKVKHKIK